jgi:D-lactate dehydrogenase
MKTFVYSTHNYEKTFLEKAAKSKIELTFSTVQLTKKTVSLSNGFDAVVLFTADKVNAAILEVLHENGVRFIALRSTGFDHVDLKKASELGMKIANVPAYSPYAIAEFSVALIQSLNRKIVLSQQLMTQHDFRLDQLVGEDLHGKTVGVVGTGTIGSVFAKIMHGFGCKLIGYDIVKNETLIQQTAITYKSLEDLCALSDIISINCPLNDVTKYMFAKKQFEQMKKGVIFINTARGGIVHTKDLIVALDNGTIAAAGLDVYENEKNIFFKDLRKKDITDKTFEKLRAHPSVLITGHQAFLTKEALQGIAETTICNLVEWSNNGTAKNELKSS